MEAVSPIPLLLMNDLLLKFFMIYFYRLNRFRIPALAIVTAQPCIGLRIVGNLHVGAVIFEHSTGSLESSLIFQSWNDSS
jgi:hypothetical protein